MKLPRVLFITAIVFALSLLPWLPSSTASICSETASISATPATAGESSASTSQKKQTVKINLLVQDAGGNEIGGARVNVWHDYFGPDPRPPDYQFETHANGRITIEVEANKTDEVTVEVNKDDLWWKGNLALSGSSISRTLSLTKISPDFFDKDESRLIKVKVRVEGEGGEGIAGARITFGDGSGGSRKIEAEDMTGQNGEVTIGVRAWRYLIYANKDGYQEGKALVSLTTFQWGKTVSAPVIKLIKKPATEAKPSVELIVNVRNASDRNGVSGAQVVLTGQMGITSGVYNGTTDSSGEARITVKEYGKFKLEISQEYFESLSSEVRIVSGETQKDLPAYLLKEKPKKIDEENLVKVTVLAGDKQKAPIAGATVKVEKTSVATDADGVATISNVIGLDATSVAVTVSATRYKSQTRMVQVRRGVQYTNASASATLVLEAGEDPLSVDTPIVLVVEVIDSFTDQPLSNTNVQIRFKGKIVQTRNTNERGEADFTLLDRETSPVAEFRAGLKVDAYHDNFVRKDSDITPDLLTPSNAARRISLYLERDWTALIKATGLLEGKIAAWDKDVKESSALPGLVQSRAEQMKLIDGRVSAMIGELTGFRGPVTGFSGPGDQLRCTTAAQLMSDLELFEAQAMQKAQEVAEKIDAATAIAANCAIASDGAVIKRHHQDAIRLAAEIGRLDKQAAAASRKLSILAKEVEAVRQTLRDAEDLVRRIDVEARTAEALVERINGDYKRGSTLSKDLGRRRDALAQEINDLKQIHGVEPRFINRLPANLKKRLDDMAALVASRNNDVFAAPNIATVDEALRLLVKIRAAKAEAEKGLAEFKSAGCNIDPLLDKVRAINQALLEASADLGLGADLPREADECARRGSCQPALDGIRSVLEEDNLELGVTKINEARAKGCDVSKAMEELDYFRTVRRTANLLAQSLENCRFQQALDLAREMPPSIKSRPLVAQALGNVQRGLQAQRRIAQTRASAKLAVERSGQRASALSYIEEAEMAADAFPCLMNEVNRFRDEYKGGSSVSKPKVEALPEDADNPPVAKGANTPRRKPTVEKIDDADDTNPADNRPPARKTPSSIPTGGSLKLANPKVKDGHRNACCGGGTDFSYGLNSAMRKDTYPPSEGGNVTVEWQFDGVPGGDVNPDDQITIIVTGTFSASLPNRDLQPAAGAGVRIGGDVDVIEQKPAYVGRTLKQDGKYVFKVRKNAKVVIIELAADYGLGTFVVYRYEAEKK
jgi:hypothetical protein